MNLDKIFSDEKYLEKELNFFINKKHIKTITKNEKLIKAHIKKAKHNLKFYNKNKNEHEFEDWLIVILYYTLYHCALALITNKEKMSKNHYATILILIKEYNINKKEAKLIYELSINKEDAELYTRLKEDRHNASYTTNTPFNKLKLKQYETEIYEFINKTEEIIHKSN